ncbi:hypothetical protein PMAYCL1PPCAC_01553, partial [Pristionchus mayeri]
MVVNYERGSFFSGDSEADRSMTEDEVEGFEVPAVEPRIDPSLRSSSIPSITPTPSNRAIALLCILLIVPFFSSFPFLSITSLSSSSFFSSSFISSSFFSFFFHTFFVNSPTFSNRGVALRRGGSIIHSWMGISRVIDSVTRLMIGTVSVTHSPSSSSSSFFFSTFSSFFFHFFFSSFFFSSSSSFFSS